MKKKLIFILSILIFISCDTASVDLDDENYVFDGRGGVKCKVNDNLLKPSVVTSPGARSVWFSLAEYDDLNRMYLSFSNRGQSPDFIDQFVTIEITGISTTTSMVGNIYNLGDEPNQGEYSIDTASSVYKTNEIYFGTLEILYHDIDNFILGGRFEFDAVNEDGEIIEIREGEFDLKYL
ncbi:hypothetical protein [Formosa algae]|uniref:Gliding motility lipoprotein GldH n=1 Tax=Formosa algae TaxID=225843 RepID=A0A9X1CDY8_9FLAO|nr:hypothetical protein [Formosa algae]MBP1841745.1 hypothetical protein [Formosa algae]MDQ0337210.1 hypothetical protein [Formosa algae]OEI81964.1 hypothetical protein AST99_01415 [Formosa algae]